jgi:hypothetical protein
LNTLGSKNNINNIISDYNRNNTLTKLVNRNYETPGSVTYFPSGGENKLGFTSRNISETKSYIAFPFYKYVRPDVKLIPTLSPLGTIVLPLPNDLKDNLDLHYGETDVDPVIQQVAQAVEGKAANMDQGKAIVESLTLKYGSEVAEKFLGTFGIGDKNSKNVGLQVFGLTVNPYLTMLFKSPRFKRFVLSWTFIPQSKKESDDLNFITNKFRYHALPDLSGADNILYVYPDMCKPILFPIGYQFDFKHCVIERISLDYVPGDMPAFQSKSSAPVAIRMTIALIEIELWTKQDMISKSENSPFVPNDNLGRSSRPSFDRISGYLS